MELTQELLSPFEGGTIEIRNIKDNTLFKGSIGAIEVNDGIKITPFEMTKNGGDLNSPSDKWIEYDQPKFYSRLESCSASDIVEGRIDLTFHLDEIVVILFMKRL